MQPGDDEGSGPVLSGGLFNGTIDDNIQGVVPGEGEPLGILEATVVDIKIGISGGEVMDNSLGAAEGFKPVVRKDHIWGL